MPAQPERTGLPAPRRIHGDRWPPARRLNGPDAQQLLHVALRFFARQLCDFIRSLTCFIYLGFSKNASPSETGYASGRCWRRRAQHLPCHQGNLQQHNRQFFLNCMVHAMSAEMSECDPFDGHTKDEKNGNAKAETIINSVHDRLSELSMELFVELQGLKVPLQDAKSAIAGIPTGENKPERQAATNEAVEDATARISPEPTMPSASGPIICHDPAMLDVLQLVRRVAPFDASVLITGESGTGKEVLVRHLHAISKRAKGPFIAVNCAAIPETLLESELFGFEKGAFTGAVARRIGKFEQAHRGTLLLDEISEMSPRLQAKLLRAVQQREVDRVGGYHPIEVDVRFAATSNRNLQEEVRKGNFREDLYFRLGVVVIEVPPLRERPRDIESLVNHFVEAYAESYRLKAPKLSEGAWQALLVYRWPGNVRELENVIHRAVVLAEDGVISRDTIIPSLVPFMGKNSDTAADPFGLSESSLFHAEREIILSTLRRCQGDRIRTAKSLGMTDQTLAAKLRQYESCGVGQLPKFEPVGKPNGIVQRFPGPNHYRLRSKDAVQRAEHVIAMARAKAKRGTTRRWPTT